MTETNIAQECISDTTAEPETVEFYPVRPAITDMPDRLPAGTQYSVRRSPFAGGKGQDGAFEHEAWKEYEREQEGAFGFGFTRINTKSFSYTDGWTRVHYSWICWDTVPKQRKYS